MRLFMRSLCAAAAALVLALAAAPARAQAPEARFAFVIGNDGYEGAPLAAAANDAGLIAETLRGAGFDVTGARNLDQDTFRAAYREFLEKVSAAGGSAVAAVYISGYGLQLEGENYLVPVGARVARDTDVPLNALRVSDFTRSLVALPGRAHIIILDLAHDGPFGKQGQKLAPGLALVEAEPNTLIAFNAAPGVVSPPAAGNYGPYAQALAEMMRQPGLPLDEIFARVRTRVAELTKGAVVPWHVSKLDPAFRLLEAAPGAPADPLVTSRIEGQRARPIRDFSAADAYGAALDRDTIAAYQDFLAAYPDSPYAKNVRGILAARREAQTWRASAAANTPNAYWSYLRRYSKGPHAADARRRLARLTAPLEPPAGFQMIEYEVGPPPEAEILYFDEAVPVFYDAAVPPPPPGFFAGPPAWWTPPPPPSYEVAAEEIYFLPAPHAPPPPPWVVVPNYVAAPVEYESLRRRSDNGGPGIMPYVAIPAALAAGIVAGKLISNRNARLQASPAPGQLVTPAPAPGSPGIGSPGIGSPGIGSPALKQPFLPSIAAPPRAPGAVGPRPALAPVAAPIQPPAQVSGRPSGPAVLPGLPGAAPLPAAPAGFPPSRPAGAAPTPGQLPPRAPAGVAVPIAPVLPGAKPLPAQAPLPTQAPLSTQAPLPAKTPPILPQPVQARPAIAAPAGPNPADARLQQAEQLRLQQQQRIEQQKNQLLERQQKQQADRAGQQQRALQQQQQQQQQRALQQQQNQQQQIQQRALQQQQQQRAIQQQQQQNQQNQQRAIQQQQNQQRAIQQQQQQQNQQRAIQQQQQQQNQQRAIQQQQQRAAPPPQPRQPAKPTCGIPGLPPCPR